MGNEAIKMKIVQVSDETDQAKLFTVKPDQDWSFVPGMVAVVGVEGVGESYFALASAPEEKGKLQFLVKDGKGAAGVIFKMKAGDEVLVKGPTGKGFPIDNYKGRDIVIQAVGSAIAPMRGVIRSILQRRKDFGKVKAVFGVRTPAEFPFKGEIEDWKSKGVDVVLTVSRPDGTDWKGKTGHVQSHCEVVLKELNKPVALICGMKDMMTQSRAELNRLGVAENEVLTNY